MNSKPLLSLTGWEAFLHGVFAISVTLLVLDIRVPDATTIGSGSALVDALRAELPRYVAYVLGFLLLGEYWLHTNRFLGWLRGVNHWYLVLGLLYLMVIASVPFATALLAEYIGLDNGRQQVAIIVFVSWQLALAILANILCLYAARGGRLLKPTIRESALRTFLSVTALGPVIWIIALLATLIVSGTVALVLIVMIMLIFLFEVPVSSDEHADGSAS